MSKMLAERLAQHLPQVEPKVSVEVPAITTEIDLKAATLQAGKMLATKPLEEVKKKPRESWLKEYKLMHIGYPEPCDRRGARKRFQV